ncbi:MAG: DUF1848 domain-containing protein, partial [Thermodesulfobacteriota bacterium]|nr:DUF1848 domain-containing protein [Thermodesulfobacteriota bacterium]
GYVNPFAGGKRYVVSLKPEDVISFVFWSKNFQPFLEPLKVIDGMGYGAIFHFTITGLPKVFESNLVGTEIAIHTLKEMSQRYSPKHIIWRYDPIIISDLTDATFHLKNFQSLASELEGYVARCFFSYVAMYGKVKRNFKKLEAEKGVHVMDPDHETKKGLANKLAGIAEDHGMKMHTCCGDFLISDKIKKARCVDGDLIRELFPHDVKRKVRSTRRGCGCTESRDIGTYDTCSHGCLYCYANMNKEKSLKAHESHDKDSAFLGYSRSQSDKWLAECDPSPDVGKNGKTLNLKSPDPAPLEPSR